MDSIAIDETFLTGAECLTSRIDEQTLAYSPAPVAASTILKESRSSHLRVPLDFGESIFLNNRSVTPEEKDHDESDDDRSSLGLLPSNYLLENDLLQGNICFPGNIPSVNTPAVSQSSPVNNSQKNRLLDSASLKEHASDSHECLTTVKKCPQAGTEKEEGRFVPHALFQSVEEVNESRLEDSPSAHSDFIKKSSESLNVNERHESTDSGVGQTVCTGNQKSNLSEAMSSGLGVQVSSSAVEENVVDEKFSQAQIEQEDADLTIPQIELEADDMEVLEETFTDFDGSDEEKPTHDVGDNETLKLSDYAEVKERGINLSTLATNFRAFPNMDGPFKIPLPPVKQQVAPISTPISSKEHETSLTFGESIQFHQSGSVIEWGPSIDFGSSTHVGEIDRDSYLVGQENKKIVPLDKNKLFDDTGCTDHLGKTIGVMSNSFENFKFGEIKSISKSEQSKPSATESGGKIFDDLTKDVSPFGDFPSGINSHENGYDFPASNNPFTDLDDGGFGDEDFVQDTEAAAAMLAEDEKLFEKDNFAGEEQLFNSTMGSVRGDEQTFMNMSIGTYIAARSGELGSLTSCDKRPEFGMQVKSPSTVRPGVSILSTDEIFSSSDQSFSPSNQNRTKSSIELLENQTSSHNSIVNADVVSDKRSPQISQNYKSQIFYSDPLNFVQRDLNKNSFLSEISQTSSKTKTLTPCSEPLTMKFIPDDLQTSATSRQQTSMSESSGKAKNDHTLGRSQLAEMKDDSLNFTSDEITFTSIYNLIDRSDISLADPGQLIVSEYMKKVQQKQETQQSKIKTSKVLNARTQVMDNTRSSKTTLQIQANLQSSRKESIQQKKMAKQPSTQTHPLQSNIDVSSLAINKLQIQGDKHPAHETELLVSKSDPKPAVKKCEVQTDKLLGINSGLISGSSLSKPIINKSQVQAEKHATVGIGLRSRTDLSKPEVNKSQILAEKHATVDKGLDSGAEPNLNEPEMPTIVHSGLSPSSDISKPEIIKPHTKGDKSSVFETALLPGRDIPTPYFQSLKNKTVKSQSLEVQTNKDLFSTITKSSQSKKDQIVEMMQSQTNTQFSESKTTAEKAPVKIDSGVASKDFRPVTQCDSNYLSTKGISQISPSWNKQTSTTSQKSIQPEKYDYQQGKSVKGSITEHKRTTPVLQTQQLMSTTVLEEQNRNVNEHTKDGNLSLECLTINSNNSTSSDLTNITISKFEASSALPNLRKEKINELSIARLVRDTLSPPENLHQLLNMTSDNTAHYNLSEMTQFHSLIHDNTNSILQSTAMQDEFVSSTPLLAHPPGIPNFTNTRVMEKTILPIITPRTTLNILDVPENVYMPEVCCVYMSQQTSFAITNLLDRGVKCQMTIRKTIFRGQNLNIPCPFELKRSVTLSPGASENVQVIFRPKNEGDYVVEIEISSWSMINPQESRTYVLKMTAYAEFPSLKVSPSNDEVDFGELLWGNSSCRSVRVQNMGRATLPLRLSIERKESSLCNFSFYREDQTDVSLISLTTRPAAVGNVYSMSLPGRKDGQKFYTEIINIYCHAKKIQNISQKYLEKAEKFQAFLSLSVDKPIEDFQCLYEMKLQVTVGMYKLHVDQEILPISAAPGKSAQGTIKIINSGNIPMPVDIYLEPQRDHFSLSTDHVVVPSGEKCPVFVTFTPQPTRAEQDDNKVNLMLESQIAQCYISVIGKVKTAETKLSASHNTVNFGGVELGKSQKQRFSFIVDNDDDIKIWIRNPGSAFQLLTEDGVPVESLEMSVVKGVQYSVHVMFSPLEVMGYNADVMMQILYANRYPIPISGYGGCSKLVIEKVNEAQPGNRWLNIGCVRAGTSIIRKITVRNDGARCCFIKTLFYDVSRQLFQSLHATIVPSSLILAAKETTDLLIMINPSQKEADLCNSGQALIAIVKLTWGDEVTRQQFVSNPGKVSGQLVKDFDIPLTSTQRDIIDIELKSMSSPVASYPQLKKAMSSLKIGILGTSAEKQSIISRTGPDINRYLSQHRPVLAPVNPNIKPTDRNKDVWTVTPSEIQLTAGGSKVNDFLQIINYSSEELPFSVTPDEGITVKPTNKGTVKPKNTVMLVVTGDPAYFLRQELSKRCGLIKVQCSQQMKCVRVYVEVTQGQLLSPKQSLSSSGDKFAPHSTTESISSDHVKKVMSKPVSETCADSDGHNTTLSTSVKKPGCVTIQGSDMIIFPTVDVGNKRGDQTYFFKNIGTGPLTWELAQFAPPYVKHADNTQNLYRVNYDVFKLSPLTGVLQPEDIEKVTIEFNPQSKGSYNQAWCIHDTSDGQESAHRFSLYAKASSGPSFVRSHSEQDMVPKGLSPTHVSTSPRDRLSSQMVATRESDMTQSNRSPVRGSGEDHLGETGMRNAKQTAKSLTIQNPSIPLNPGASWSPVSHSDEEMSHCLVGSIQKPSSNPTNLGETNVWHNTMKEAEISLEGIKSLLSSCSFKTALDGDSSRSEEGKVPKPKGLNLVNDVVEFPKLQIGESTIRKVYLKNLSNEDIQIIIENEPKPPFMIKHHTFRVGKDKMIMFPVTFKPKHVAEFKDKVVFRDTRSGNSITAVLLAESVNKVAVK